MKKIFAVLALSTMLMSISSQSHAGAGQKVVEFSKQIARVTIGCPTSTVLTIVNAGANVLPLVGYIPRGVDELIEDGYFSYLTYDEGTAYLMGGAVALTVDAFSAPYNMTLNSRYDGSDSFTVDVINNVTELTANSYFDNDSWCKDGGRRLKNLFSR